MSTEIARQETSSVEMARLMADSTLLPRAYQKQPANLLFAFEYADALGIPRINALTSIHVIDGKPTASADLIAALVRRAGHKLRIEGDDTYAEATIIRADDPDYVPTPIRWDQAKAKKAGKWGAKGPWSQYPAAMLRARAITEAARMWASDALYGVIYTPEELGAVVDEDGNPVVAEPRTAPPQRTQARRDTPPATSMDALAQAAATEPEPVIDEDSYRELLASITDLDTLQAVWKENTPNLDGPALRVFNRLVSERKKQIIAAEAEAAVETVQETLDAELIEDDGAA